MPLSQFIFFLRDHGLPVSLSSPFLVLYHFLYRRKFSQLYIVNFVFVIHSSSPSSFSPLPLIFLVMKLSNLVRIDQNWSNIFSFNVLYWFMLISDYKTENLVRMGFTFDAINCFYQCFKSWGRPLSIFGWTGMGLVYASLSTHGILVYQVVQTYRKLERIRNKEEEEMEKERRAVEEEEMFWLSTVGYRYFKNWKKSPELDWKIVPNWTGQNHLVFMVGLVNTGRYVLAWLFFF